MGFSFRRSVKILPGVRLNFSKSGVSTSVSALGVTQNFSKRGKRTTINLPGVGLNHTSYAKRQPAYLQRQPASEKKSGSTFQLVALVIAVLVVAVMYVLR
jgi:hypothetical protein